MKNIFLTFALLVASLSSLAADLRGRMGVGLSNQLANEIPAVSFKIQQSKSFALGALVGFKSDQDNFLYGAGVKMYRIIFDEPQLNFYLGGLLATETYVNQQKKVDSGFQLDGTMGTEFHLSGLESIGFSFEFGLSYRKVNDQGGSSFETLGDHFLKAAMHFYL